MTNEHTDSRQLLQTLRTNAFIILDVRSHLGEVRQAVLNLASLFYQLTGLVDDPLAREQYQDTILPSGKALSPPNAAQCLLDFLRAARFLQGILAAIEEAQRRFPGECIEILYAGSGPFAPLALPLMAVLRPGSVRFTIVDIHASSIESVNTLIQGFQFSAFVRALVVSDATTYQHHSEQSLHIIVVETMQRALAQEPQVAITLNLAPQLRPGGIFVPERIQVLTCLCDPRREFAIHTDGEGGETERVRIHLGTIFDLRADQVDTLVPGIIYENDGRRVSFPAVNVMLPSYRPVEATQFLLLTHITTFGVFWLRDYDSFISSPLRISALSTLPEKVSIQFKYYLQPIPGFEYALIS